MTSDISDTVDLLLDVQDTLETVRLLEENESSLNQLYGLFAQKYPKYADFWIRIAYDEEEHASWVRKLYNEVSNKRIRFRKNRFDIKALRKFLENIYQQIERFEKSQLPVYDAALVSVQFEEDMIERSFFEVYDTDSEIVRITLNKLETSTEIHYQKVKEMFGNLATRDKKLFCFPFHTSLAKRIM